MTASLTSQYPSPIVDFIKRRDSTDGRVAALYPADPGSNPVVSMLQRALRLSVSAGRQTQLIMNRSWSQTLIVALLHWLDYKTLQLLLLLLITSVICHLDHRPHSSFTYPHFMEV